MQSYTIRDIREEGKIATGQRASGNKDKFLVSSVFNIVNFPALAILTFK